MKQWIYRWLPTLAFIVVLPCLIALGFWQLSRAHEKEAMLAALADSTHETPLTLSQVLQNPKQYHYYGVSIEGKFLPGNDVLLMHQMQAQDVGYHVLSLFQPASGGLPLWVDRGFLSVRHKNEIPPPPTQPLALRGIIDQPEPDRFILGENVMFPEKRPLEIQRVDVDELSTLTGRAALPVVVLAETDLQDGLVRKWEIVVMPPAKHYGYAVQWFALAACLVVIYIVLNFRKGAS
ncbi:MAG: SURF1 family protein [Gammaproteobacteria bacterium]